MLGIYIDGTALSSEVKMHVLHGAVSGDEGSASAGVESQQKV